MPRRGRIPLVLAAIIAALVLPACFLISEAKRLGVSAGPSGGVRLHFVPCPGERVTKIAYLEGVGTGFATESGNDEPADDPDDDEILRWLVVAPGGSNEREFEIGVTPPGFTEHLPLDEPPAEVSAPAAWIAYANDGEIGSYEIGFDADLLDSGSILTLDGRKDPATFEREGRESCG